MRKLSLIAAACAALVSISGGAFAADLKKELRFGCASPGGYYCKGHGEGFKDAMGDNDNGGHRVEIVSGLAGSFELNDAVAAGEVDVVPTQSDAYALDRAEDRAFAQRALAMGVIGQEAVIMVAPKGTTWGQFRRPNPAVADGKWIIKIKAGSGAVAPGRLISQYDPQIAANVIFEEVPKNSYDLTSILGDISFGDADGVLWVSKPNACGDDFELVNDNADVDFVATGFQKYADEILVGNRRKAPVYDVKELPVESSDPTGYCLDLIAGGGRKIPMLVVNVLGLVNADVPAGSKEHIKAVFADQSAIAPASGIAEKVMNAYNDGLAAASEAWASID